MVEWPPALRVGKSLKSLVSGLLTVNASERIGKGGVLDIMEHPWLSNMDWDKIRERKYLVSIILKTSHACVSECILGRLHMSPMNLTQQTLGMLTPC